MKVALCIIVTGKYKRFLCELLATAERYFCAGHEVQLFVFTDADPILILPPSSFRLHPFPAPHEPWPGPTLHRYRTMLQAADDLLACDYVYYIDVDSRFVRPVGEEIFGGAPGAPGRGLTATIHFGYTNRPRGEWTYEHRPFSRACVWPGEGKRYYCGGFQGGRAAHYVEAMRIMNAAIADDEGHGITAVWHDESHWNRYLIDHKPEVELSHDYMCPPQWRPQTQRIVIVGKNNAEIRADRPEETPSHAVV